MTALDDVPAEVTAEFNVQVEQPLPGGSQNRFWAVTRGDQRYVLRRYARPPFGSIRYELDVLGFLGKRGWPVPTPESEPAELCNETWGLFRWLPGQRLDQVEDPAGQRARGQLLAELHAATDELTASGQRPGCRTAEEVILDPVLHRGLADYEARFPEPGHLLRWHAELAAELFAATDTSSACMTVVHSDFAPWNLLRQGDDVTGIVDFDATHLNFAVGDFACAWRGKYDDVITGYEHVRPLSDLDRYLITPVFWGWLFIGVADGLAAISAGEASQDRLAWMMSKLPLRTPAMGKLALTYPGSE